MTQTMQSADGSTIAYEKVGTGPAVIIIGGAFNTRHSTADLAPLLASHFSVFSYDRRGRGDSTEAGPYALEREIEDLAAVIDAAGGSAGVYGHSSGAVLALEATLAGLPIRKLALYEPPFTPPAHGVSSEAWTKDVQAAVDAGDREGAAVLFLRGVGADDAAIESVKQLPWWGGMLAVAHTLPYDVGILGDGSVPAERLARVTVPTLLMFGGDSPPWAENAAAPAAEAIPAAAVLRVEGQGHNVDSATIAPTLIDFFG
jgi:pimeloyl-ACP methyl ester carboxylesterase